MTDDKKITRNQGLYCVFEVLKDGNFTMRYKGASLSACDSYVKEVLASDQDVTLVTAVLKDQFSVKTEVVTNKVRLGSNS